MASKFSKDYDQNGLKILSISNPARKEFHDPKIDNPDIAAMKMIDYFDQLKESNHEITKPIPSPLSELNGGDTMDAPVDFIYSVTLSDRNSDYYLP